jgi:hypothetical protein
VNRLEKIVNVAILVTCCLVVGNLARNVYLEHKVAARFIPSFNKGQVVKLAGYTPSSKESTLVMVLSTHCHFCQANAPFYQKLAVFKNASPNQLQLVAVLPEKQDEASAYISGHGIGADAVLSMSLTQIGVKGTPTLLLLDNQGKVEDFWVGQLDDSQQKKVFDRLKKDCANCSVPEAGI